MAHTLQPSDIVKRAHAVGSYYGFTPLSTLAATKKGQGAKAPYPDTLALDTLDTAAKDVAALLKQVRDAGLTPSAQQPLFFWHTNAAQGRPAPKQIVIQFHVLGVEHAIADAVLIRAVRSLMHDLGKQEPVLRLNSMGDKETRGRLTRELTQLVRKHQHLIPPEVAEHVRQGQPVRAAHLLAQDENLKHFLPSPTDHLSEASRKHFEAVLEYLESTETPYELSPHLYSRANAWTETCFELAHDADDSLHAWGSRYSELARPFFKGAVHSVGAVVRVNAPSRDTVAPIKERGNPRFVFVHIGDEAKRESMKMADELRKARIPLTQAMGVASLTEQMRLAETMNPPYLLIMGRKEALERSVILRERATHTETFIPLSGLIERLKAVA